MRWNVKCKCSHCENFGAREWHFKMVGDLGNACKMLKMKMKDANFSGFSWNCEIKILVKNIILNLKACDRKLYIGIVETHFAKILARESCILKWLERDLRDIREMCEKMLNCFFLGIVGKMLIYKDVNLEGFFNGGNYNLVKDRGKSVEQSTVTGNIIRWNETCKYSRCENFGANK